MHKDHFLSRRSREDEGREAGGDEEENRRRTGRRRVDGEEDMNEVNSKQVSLEGKTGMVSGNVASGLCGFCGSIVPSVPCECCGCISLDCDVDGVAKDFSFSQAYPCSQDCSMTSAAGGLPARKLPVKIFTTNAG